MLENIFSKKFSGSHQFSFLYWLHLNQETSYQKQKYFQTLSHLLSEFFAMKTTGIDNCTYWLVMIDKTYKKHKSCYMGVPRSRI